MLELPPQIRSFCGYYRDYPLFHRTFLRTEILLSIESMISSMKFSFIKLIMAVTDERVVKTKNGERENPAEPRRIARLGSTINRGSDDKSQPFHRDRSIMALASGGSLAGETSV